LYTDIIIPTTIIECLQVMLNEHRSDFSFFGSILAYRFMLLFNHKEEEEEEDDDEDKGS